MTVLVGYHRDGPHPARLTGLTSGERRLLAAVCRWARSAGWHPGHRLGWVHQVHGVAVSYEPGTLSLWRRAPDGQWPTFPREYEVDSLHEVLHILVGLELLPDWFCAHGRQALVEVARMCDRIADDMVQIAGWSPTGHATVAAQTCRELAHRIRHLAGLVVPR